MNQLRRDDLVFPDLSFKVIGCAFDVFNKLGFGHPEKYYQKAFAISLKEQKLDFKEQVYFNLKYNDEVVGKIFLDFLIEEKVIVELKKNSYLSKQHIGQVNQYLKTTNLQLAILINFTQQGVVYKRLLNINK